MSVQRRPKNIGKYRIFVQKWPKNAGREFFLPPFSTLSLLSGLVCFPSLSLLPGLPPQPSWRLPRMPWGFSACGFVAGGEAPLSTLALTLVTPYLVLLGGG